MTHITCHSALRLWASNNAYNRHGRSIFTFYNCRAFRTDLTMPDQALPLLHIFQHLGWTERARASLVCKVAFSAYDCDFNALMSSFVSSLTADLCSKRIILLYRLGIRSHGTRRCGQDWISMVARSQSLSCSMLATAKQLQTPCRLSRWNLLSA